MVILTQKHLFFALSFTSVRWFCCYQFPLIIFLTVNVPFLSETLTVLQRVLHKGLSGVFSAQYYLCKQPKIKILSLINTLCLAALRDLQGNYLLNGNWRIDLPLPKEMAGTVFRYTRGKQGSDEAETLTADRPTNQPLFLVVNQSFTIMEKLCLTANCFLTNF